MRRIRISLRGLLILVTAIVLFMGWSQYRRRTILEQSKDLKEDGYVFAVPDTWYDAVIWQRKPSVGTVNYPGGEETVVYCVLRTPEKDFLGEITSPEEVERLKRLGVVDY